MNLWPRQSLVLEGTSVYGNPKGKGGGAPSPAWEAANLVMMAAPWAMMMGDIKITRFRVHKQCQASLGRVFANLKQSAGGDYKTLSAWGVTKFGGAYNYRLMRGGSNLSMHSYGCAIDLDPANNGLGDSTPRFAEFPRVLAAFADEGWLWGGDWNGNGSTADERRCDGMHWQATAGLVRA